MPGYPDGDIFRAWRKVAPGDRQRREVQFQEKIGVKGTQVYPDVSFLYSEKGKRT